MTKIVGCSHTHTNRCGRIVNAFGQIRQRRNGAKSHCVEMKKNALCTGYEVLVSDPHRLFVVRLCSQIALEQSSRMVLCGKLWKGLDAVCV